LVSPVITPENTQFIAAQLRDANTMPYTEFDFKEKYRYQNGFGSYME